MNDGNDDEPQTDVVPYAVGYGKPPTEHKFQKGRSGNPNGRPKRRKSEPVISFRFGNEPAVEMFKQEAYRTVTLREGEKILELPSIQAVFRAMNVAALKGNRFVQKTLVETARQIEADERRAHLEYLETMFTYKTEWTKAIERARAQGLPEPQPLPHPDDIIIDPNTCVVRVQGPKTPEQKESFDKAIAARDVAQEEVAYFADKHKKARDADKKAFWLRLWIADQKLFDTINEALPPRFRKELQHRTYAPGASRKGDFEKKYLKRAG